MEYRRTPTYISLSSLDETRLLTILAQNHDSGTPTFFHECFNIDNFALVFDIDGKAKSKTLDQILKPMFSAVREIFETGDDSIFNCVVFTASSENKMSYHIHWPDIIVNKKRMKDVYAAVFRHDKSMQDFIDASIPKNCKLRMAFSDKWDKDINGPAGRELSYLGSYNNNGVSGKRYFPEWENNTYELLLKARVRRSEGTPLTPVNKRGTTIESLAFTNEDENFDIDMNYFAENDFAGMPPEYYTLNKMQSIVTYIQNRFESADNEIFFEKIVSYMNNFVCMISDHPGKTIYIVRKYNPDGGNQKWKYIQKSQRDFLQTVEHIKCQVMTINHKNKETKYITTTIGNIWMTHPKRKSYSTIIFDPDPSHTTKKENFNLYQGLRISTNDLNEIIETQVDYMNIIKPITDHILKVWCNNDSCVYDYVIRWLASATLKPWHKIGTALVLVGGEGCGKSMVVDAIGHIFGSHYLHIMDMEDMLGKFCSILEDKLFVFADEAFWGGCKSLAGKLKGMITEPQIRCEHKGFDTYYVDNYTNYIIASNNSHAVPAGENARRWVCLGCSNRFQGNTDYFKQLKSSLYDDDHLGVKCLLYYFKQHLNLDEWVPQKVPITNLLRAQKTNSYDSIELFWDSVLHRKYILPWNEYMYLDPTAGATAEHGGQYDYQIMPFQRLYSIYKEEMQGQIGKIYALQRFKQYMKDKDFFQKIDPPDFAECKREMWIRLNFDKCRENWKKAHCDPNMEFDT